MVVIIGQSILDEMFAYGRSNLPNEACGVLLGSRQNPAAIRINKAVPMTNISPRPMQTFEIDPLELLPYVKPETGDSSMVGFFHTHSSTDPVPSSKDLKTEWHTAPTHWIISYADPHRPQARCYQYMRSLRGIEFTPFDIVIEK